MKKQQDNDEGELFRQTMQSQGVRPIQCDVIMPLRPLPPPIPKQRYLDEEAIRQDMLSEQFDPTELETGEELLFVRSGLQRSIFDKLRRGYFSVGAELDLHGMVVKEAREAIAEFLYLCRHRNVRCVRIVHGKGYNSWQKQPVLKTKLGHWLRQRDEVLAFCSARPIDGGTGAIYVLLKGSGRRQLF